MPAPFHSTRSGAGKLLLPVLLVCSSGMIFALQYGFIFLMLALLPSIVAYYIDDEKGKPVFKIIFAANLSGLLPTLGPMLDSAIKLKPCNLSGVIDNPIVWLMIYGSAAAGWGLLFFCRSIARFIAMAAYARHITALEKLQQKLVDEWGVQIKHKPGESEPNA